MALTMSLDRYKELLRNRSSGRKATDNEKHKGNSFVTSENDKFQRRAKGGHFSASMHAHYMYWLLLAIAIVCWKANSFTMLPDQLNISSYGASLSTSLGAAGRNDTDKSLKEVNPYISTVREEKYPPRPTDFGATLNLFEIFSTNECLPSPACTACLGKKGSNCEICAQKCTCYCKELCKTEAPTKYISKKIIVTPPERTKDSNRIIPRIIHQTWYEPITKEKYPDMSRMVESWKNSGWEYRFYDDNAITKFLSTYFPPEIIQAFDAVIPGAFKADIFRYCVLLIHGGVYADVDVLLESNLDAVIADDIGFMLPHDQPGRYGGHGMCLWNGFMAAAPGHPYLLGIIERAVNNIRNRFNAIDINGLLCPEPDLFQRHGCYTLHITGPCILGAAINTVLGRHMQTQFDSGDVDVWGEEENDGEGIDIRGHIPGRTVILEQIKNDMGAHRFTWSEKNILVAATDMFDSKRNAKRTHYHKTCDQGHIYGLKKVYANSWLKDEDIRMVLEGTEKV